MSKLIYHLIPLLGVIYFLTKKKGVSNEIGKQVIANRPDGLGMWSQPDLNSTLLGTYFAGDYVGTINNIVPGNDGSKWYQIGAGYVHAVPANLILK